MNQLGCSLNIYPSKTCPGDYIFAAVVSTWEDGKCISTRTIANRVVILATPPSGEPDNDLWVLDLLEVGSQIVEREITPPRLEGVIPANAKPLDTTEKASHP